MQRGGGVVAPERPEGREGRASRLRGDVDGLRAVAILLVVAYHVGLSAFSGGFVGVDVFFVISGFLITRNLLVESRGTGRVALLAFWARRIRRLVPAMTVMVAGVLVLSLAVLSALQWQTVASQARAAVLYVSNLVYAHDATDYFGQDIRTSLFLHTWSLGVEEQFYLVWPVLVGLAALAVRARRHLLRPLLLVAFGVTLAASFVLCVRLTDGGSPYAFFGLPARAWEFAAAGLLAAMTVPSWLRGRHVRTALAVAGILLIAGAALGLDASTAYPGWRPLIPVTGTLLVLVAGSPDTGADVSDPTAALGPLEEDAIAASLSNPLSAALAVAPMQWLGRVSYSWYLWHWPLILLAVAWVGRDRLWLRMAAAAVALVVAAAVHRLVEDPVRFSPRLVGRRRRTYVLGAALTALALLATVGVDRLSDRDLVRYSGVSLADVRASRKVYECAHETQTTDGIEYCEDGALDSPRTLLLVGDSHARQWKPAFTQAARDEGVRLLVRWMSVCPATPTKVLRFNKFEENADCDRFRADTDRLVSELHPDAVVVSSSNDYGQTILGDHRMHTTEERAAQWGADYERFLVQERSQHIRVGAIADTPRMPSDPLDCLAEEPVDACAAPRDAALDAEAPFADAEQEARDHVGGAPVLDVNPILCGPEVCPVVLDGLPVYTDLDHLYSAFVLTLVPQVRTFVAQLMA